MIKRGTFLRMECLLSANALFGYVFCEKQLVKLVIFARNKIDLAEKRGIRDIITTMLKKFYTSDA